VQTETIVFFLGNMIKFSSAVLIFGSRSMVALCIGDDTILENKAAIDCHDFGEEG